jgi:hypothetical protein
MIGMTGDANASGHQHTQFVYRLLESAGSNPDGSQRSSMKILLCTSYLLDVPGRIQSQ